MAKQFPFISEESKSFIEKQKMFFVATAPKEGRINLSPKGLDTFRILGENRVAWLSLTGSGNETDAHLLENNRITIMFCAFEGAPKILRLYGKAKTVYKRDKEWLNLISLFPTIAGTRQIFDVEIDCVQTSCGMSIPYYEFKEERKQLNNWAEKKGEEGLEAYWKDRNQKSIDGLPSKIISEE